MGESDSAMKFWKLLFAIGGVGIALVALTMFRIYGVETHHKSRNSIWWTERGKNLIPPTATDIALQQDLLDHYATYTVSEKDLNAFLDKRFARNGKAIDSFSYRSQVDPAKVGKPIGRLGWNVSKETVVYDYAASNGGVHTYYHDPSTGRTYQRALHTGRTTSVSTIEEIQDSPFTSESQLPSRVGFQDRSFKPTTQAIFQDQV